MKTFYFNTGVNITDNPHIKGGIDSGNGVVVIPFDCEDVPTNAKFKFASDYPDQKTHDPNFIVREVLNSELISKYAFFELSPLKTAKNIIQLKRAFKNLSMEEFAKFCLEYGKLIIDFRTKHTRECYFEFNDCFALFEVENDTVDKVAYYTEKPKEWEVVEKNPLNLARQN